jgi:hypothetical protein
MTKTFKTVFDENVSSMQEQIVKVEEAAKSPKSADDALIDSLQVTKAVNREVDLMVSNIMAVLQERPVSQIKFLEFKTWIPLLQAAWDGMKAILSCFNINLEFKVPGFVKAIAGFIGFKL